MSLAAPRANPSDLSMIVPLDPTCATCAISPDIQMLGIFSEAFSQLGYENRRDENGGLRSASPEDASIIFSDGARPSVVIVDIDNSHDPFAALSNLKRYAAPDATILVVGGQNDISLYRGLMEMGISEYLVKPLGVDEIVLSCRSPRPAKSKSVQEEASSCEATAIIGVRGGIGSSSLAVNLAYWIANKKDVPTALLDLDLSFGTSALTLDLEASTGLRESLENPDRLDSLLVESAIIKQSSKLSLLGSEDDLTLKPRVSPRALEGLIAELENGSEQIIVDFPRQMLPNQAEAMSSFQRFILVTDRTLAGLRDTIRIARFLRQTAPDAVIKCASSDVSGTARHQLSPEEFEHSYGMKIDFSLPQEEKVALKAAGLGETMTQVDEHCAYSEMISRLAVSLCGEEEAPAQKTLWTKMKGLVAK